MGILFRHKQMRDQQKDMVKDIWQAINSQKHFIGHAPCGIGKTDASISPALTYALKEGMTVFFLTPKLSQHKLACKVFSDLVKINKLNIKGVDIVGRKNMCSDFSIKNIDAPSFYNLCKDLRTKKQCGFFNNTIGKGLYTFFENPIESFFEELTEPIYYHTDFALRARQKELCAYEASLEMAKKSNFIVADYYQIFLPDIRTQLFKKIKLDLKDTIIIVDEAHNLPSRLSSHLSKSISTRTMLSVEREIRETKSLELHLPEMFNQIMMKQFNVLMSYEKQDNLEQKVVEKQIIDEFVEKLGYSLFDLLDLLLEVSEIYVSRGNLSSKAAHLREFLIYWFDEEHEEDHLRAVFKTKEGFRLFKKNLDPSFLISILKQAHSSIFMSGTLSPLDMYRQIFGFEKNEVIMREYISPFKKTKRINIISNSLTSKYSKRNDEQYKKFAETIVKISNKTPGGVGVFFPSYAFLKKTYGFVKNCKKKIYVQQQNSNSEKTAKLIEDFRKSKGVLFGVQGGSLSEGIDLNKNEIKTVIIVGIPLAEKNLETQAIIDHYDKKFGKGWEYGYIYPAITKAIQSAGRAIRKEGDTAAIVFLDERYLWDNYRKAMPKNLRFIVSSNPEKQVEEFFKSLF